MGTAADVVVIATPSDTHATAALRTGASVDEATHLAGEFFDPGGLRDVAARTPSGSADAFAGGLVTHVTAWSGRTASSGFDDDVTVVVVERVSSQAASLDPTSGQSGAERAAPAGLGPGRRSARSPSSGCAAR